MRSKSFSRVEVGEIVCVITPERNSAIPASPREEKESVGFCYTRSGGVRGGAV